MKKMLNGDKYWKKDYRLVSYINVYVLDRSLASLRCIFCVIRYPYRGLYATTSKILPFYIITVSNFG